MNVEIMFTLSWLVVIGWVVAVVCQNSKNNEEEL